MKPMHFTIGGAIAAIITAIYWAEEIEAAFVEGKRLLAQLQPQNRVIKPPKRRRAWPVS